MGLFSSSPDKEYEKARHNIDRYVKTYKQVYKDKALEHLNNAMRENHKDALYTYACYLSQKNIFHSSINMNCEDEVILGEVIKILEKLVSLNDMRSCKILGDYYYQNQQYEKAIEYLEKVENNHYSSDYQNLLNCYSKLKEYQKMIDLLLYHQQNDKYFHDLSSLASAYNKAGKKEEAYTYYKKLADAGSHDACYWLMKYYDEKGMYDVVLSYFQKTLNATSYYAREYIRNMIKNNKIQFTKVKEMYENHIFDYWANEDLGILYKEGIGVAKDESKAFYYFNSIPLDKLSNVNQATRNFLGDCYFYGKWTLTNYETAKMYYLSVADCYKYVSLYKNPEYFYTSTFTKEDVTRYKELGECYYQSKEYEYAVYLFEKALSKGDRANFVLDHLGRCYLNSWGVNNNDKKAVELFKEAASHNYGYSHHMMGWCYNSGRGVEKDYKKALECYMKAESLTHQGATQYNLGLIYKNGSGVDVDLYKAKEWFLKAQKNNYSKAADRLKELEIMIEKFEEEKAQKELEDAVNNFTKSVEELKNTVDNLTNKDTGNIVKTEIEEKKVVEDIKVDQTASTAKDELNQLIGLDNVKKQVKTLENLIKRNKLNEQLGLPLIKVSKHMIFTGNAGTGKTTVARIIARIFKENGLISKGHFIETDSTGLTEGYIRQSSTKTLKVLNEALGGVLFIDEAYNLILDENRNDFGYEVITVINKFMDDHRDDMVIIAAGYEKDMERFINANDGLKSRFTTRIHFPDYSNDELQAIFDLFASQKKLHASDEAKEKLLVLWEESRKYKNAGNGRAARNVFEKTIEVQSNRLIENNITDIHLVTTIEAEDIPLPEDVFY